MTKVLGSKETFLEAEHDTAMEFLNTVSDITAVEEYQRLKEFTHHRSTTRYQHCLNVAWYTFIWCKAAGLNYKSAARGAMLHDFYLYDSNDELFKQSGLIHNLHHPRVALENAKKLFEVDEIMEDCILYHMFPVGEGKPKTQEGYVVTVADKYCASLEWGSGKAKKIVPVLKDIRDYLKDELSDHV